MTLASPRQVCRRGALRPLSLPLFSHEWLRERGGSFHARRKGRRRWGAAIMRCGNAVFIARELNFYAWSSLLFPLSLKTISLFLAPFVVVRETPGASERGKLLAFSSSPSLLTLRRAIVASRPLTRFSSAPAIRRRPFPICVPRLKGSLRRRFGEKERRLVRSLSSSSSPSLTFHLPQALSLISRWRLEWMPGQSTAAFRAG